MIHFHHWVYGHDVRKCKKCGLVQEYRWFPGLDEPIWVDRDSPLLCDECHGSGEVLDENLDIVPCKCRKEKNVNA